MDEIGKRPMTELALDWYAIKEAFRQISQRKKLMKKVTDRLEYGWEVVVEYQEEVGKVRK